MARRTALSWLLLVAAVLLVHGLTLDWAARAISVPALRAVPAPIFTRLLMPEEPDPPAPPAPKKPATRVPRPHEPTIAIATPAPVEVAAAPSLPPQASAQETMSQPAPAAPELPQASAAPTSGMPAISATASAEGWPPDTRLSYRVGGFFRGEIHGKATVQWQRDALGYQVAVDIGLGLATFVMTSQGEFSAEGLHPRMYQESRNGSPRNLAVGEESVVLSDGTTVPRPPGLQDTASQFVELSQRFASGREPLEVGNTLSFWMARPGGTDLWTYDVAERETLRTPQYGDVEAFRLKPRPLARPRGNITAEMWFAPSLKYLPVRIKVSMGDGVYVDLLIEKIEQR
ncbi:MAG: DUF3108 domain-containing protein [Burkholderiales bacterium]|nr:DUF3108 domain-containing protein [Burkholderiales bacterium]